MPIKPAELVIRCYVEKTDNDQWQAFCIDLNLAAQGDSLEESRQKLHAMIVTYVTDALIGEDKEYAEQLLTRKAPLYFQAKYHFYRFMKKALHMTNDMHSVFKEKLPMAPASA